MRRFESKNQRAPRFDLFANPWIVGDYQHFLPETARQTDCFIPGNFKKPRNCRHSSEQPQGLRRAGIQSTVRSMSYEGLGPAYAGATEHLELESAVPRAETAHSTGIFKPKWL